jgi:hypothetical protein
VPKRCNKHSGIREHGKNTLEGQRPVDGAVLVTENARAEDEKALLQEVVSLDLRLILTRLRSEDAKRTQRTTRKPKLITQLNEILDKSVKTRPGITEQRLKCIRDRARALQALFIRLERISSPSGGTAEVEEILKEMVIEAHEICSDLLTNRGIGQHNSHFGQYQCFLVNKHLASPKVEYI